MDWDAIARQYGVRRCRACARRDHRRGEMDRLGTVHWADRRSTKAGLRRYLMLIASARLLHYETLPEWQRLYTTNVWAARAAQTLHLRLPRALSLTDRARVRWLTYNDPAVPVSVRRWANRGAHDV